jgi:hypothetical protein
VRRGAASSSQVSTRSSVNYYYYLFLIYKRISPTLFIIPVSFIHHSNLTLQTRHSTYHPRTGSSPDQKTCRLPQNSSSSALIRTLIFFSHPVISISLFMCFVKKNSRICGHMHHCHCPASTSPTGCCDGLLNPLRLPSMT